MKESRKRCEDVKSSQKRRYKKRKDDIKDET